MDYVWIITLPLSGIVAFIIWLFLNGGRINHLDRRRTIPGVPADAFTRFQKSAPKPMPADVPAFGERRSYFIDGERGSIEVTDFIQRTRVSNDPLEPGVSPAYRATQARTNGDDDGEARPTAVRRAGARRFTF